MQEFKRKYPSAQHETELIKFLKLEPLIEKLDVKLKGLLQANDAMKGM